MAQRGGFLIYLKALCRVCAKFTGTTSIHISDQLSADLDHLLDIKIRPEDGILPSGICGTCSTQIKHWKEFKTDTSKAQEFFSEKLLKLEVKSEQDDIEIIDLVCDDQNNLIATIEEKIEVETKSDESQNVPSEIVQNTCHIEEEIDPVVENFEETFEKKQESTNNQNMESLEEIRQVLPRNCNNKKKHQNKTEKNVLQNSEQFSSFNSVEFNQEKANSKPIEHIGNVKIYNLVDINPDLENSESDSTIEFIEDTECHKRKHNETEKIQNVEFITDESSSKSCMVPSKKSKNVEVLVHDISENAEIVSENAEIVEDIDSDATVENLNCFQNIAKDSTESIENKTKKDIEYISHGVLLKPCFVKLECIDDLVKKEAQISTSKNLNSGAKNLKKSSYRAKKSNLKKNITENSTVSDVKKKKVSKFTNRIKNCSKFDMIRLHLMLEARRDLGVMTLKQRKRKRNKRLEKSKLELQLLNNIKKKLKMDIKPRKKSKKLKDKSCKNNLESISHYDKVYGSESDNLQQEISEPSEVQSNETKIFNCDVMKKIQDGIHNLQNSENETEILRTTEMINSEAIEFVAFEISKSEPEDNHEMVKTRSNIKKDNETLEEIVIPDVIINEKQIINNDCEPLEEIKQEETENSDELLLEPKIEIKEEDIDSESDTDDDEFLDIFVPERLKPTWIPLKKRKISQVHIYKCARCREKFKTPDLYAYHVQRNQHAYLNEKFPYLPCPHCGEQFKHFKQLSRHQKMHVQNETQ